MLAIRSRRIEILSYYTVLNALPTKSKSKEPAMAIIKDVKLNPVTSRPRIILAKNPPTIAPTIPKTIAPITPPLEGCGSIAFATVPAINPKMIQPTAFNIEFRIKFRDKR